MSLFILYQNLLSDDEQKVQVPSEMNVYYHASIDWASKWTSQWAIPMYLISYALFGCIATRFGEFEEGINKAIYNQHQDIT